MENKIPLGFVYYLQNPLTAEIFYVGSTQISLKNRLRTHYQHLSEVLNNKRKMNKRYEYLLNLKGIKATIHLLEIVTDGNLDEREIFYIKHFRKINSNLTNMTNGGKGGFTTLFYTKEEKIKYGHKIKTSNKNRKKPKEFAEKMSKQRIGLGNPNAKEIPLGWLVADRKYLFKYGFEINIFIGTVYAAGNVCSSFKNNRKGKPYGHKWELFSSLSVEIQDIVQSLYENIE